MPESDEFIRDLAAELLEDAVIAEDLIKKAPHMTANALKSRVDLLWAWALNAAAERILNSDKSAGKYA